MFIDLIFNSWVMLLIVDNIRAIGGNIGGAEFVAGWHPLAELICRHVAVALDSCARHGRVSSFFDFVRST